MMFVYFGMNSEAVTTFEMLGQLAVTLSPTSTMSSRISIDNKRFVYQFDLCARMTFI